MKVFHSQCQEDDKDLCVMLDSPSNRASTKIASLLQRHSRRRCQLGSWQLLIRGPSIKERFSL